MQATFVIMGLFLLQIPQRYARQEAIVLLVQLYQLVAQWVSIMVVLELQMRVSVGLVQQETIALLMIVLLDYALRDTSVLNKYQILCLVLRGLIILG